MKQHKTWTAFKQGGQWVVNDGIYTSPLHYSVKTFADVKAQVKRIEQRDGIKIVVRNGK
jgi:hypothetical protein